MKENKLLNNAERYKEYIGKLSRMFEAEIALCDDNGKHIFRSSNGNGSKRSLLTSKVLNKVLSDVKISGSTVIDNNNSCRIIGVPVGNEVLIRGFIVAGYGNDSKRQQPVTSVRLPDILRDLSGLMEEHISLQYDIDSLASELSTRYEELNLIYSIGDKLKVAENTSSTIRYIIKEASKILQGKAIMLSVPDKGILEYVSYDVNYIVDNALKTVNELREICSSERTHVVVNKRDEFKISGFKNRKWFKFVATSVKVKDEHKGVLVVFNENKERDYTTGDLKLLTVLAEQLSIIITNNELYQNLKEFLLNLVKSMVSAIEAKDKYTRGHSERVNKISVMIAAAMGLEQKDIENISWASILHDIGKIGIPEKVLIKPGRLTDNEYAFIKTHPGKGYEILKPIVELKEALQGIRYHQERYDGKGYPEGLRHDSIPLYARIIAVADTYDSITSSRAYRARNSHINAMKEIDRVSGSQLDPSIVDVFRKLCNDNPDFIRDE